MRPEKKENRWYRASGQDFYGSDDAYKDGECNGWNNCVDGFNAFLPSEEELFEMIVTSTIGKMAQLEYFRNRKAYKEDLDFKFGELTKAIHKRLEGQDVNE
jgi:hypothetical protein